MIGFIENLTLSPISIGSVNIPASTKVIVFGNRGMLSIQAEGQFYQLLNGGSINVFDQEDVLLTSNNAAIEYNKIRNIANSVSYVTTFDKVMWNLEMGNIITGLIVAYFIDNSGNTASETKIKESLRLIRLGNTSEAVVELNSVVVAGSIWTQVFIDRIRDFVISYSS